MDTTQEDVRLLSLQWIFQIRLTRINYTFRVSMFYKGMETKAYLQISE